MTRKEYPLTKRTIPLPEKLSRILASRPRKRLTDPSRKPSAVLIPLYSHDEDYHILFTRRTELVHHHKGEISFPGGAYDPTDGTLLNTALRESCEEIGLAPQDVLILGELDDMFTKGSPYVISPFVGLVQPGYSFKISQFEIAELIDIRILDLLSPTCRRDEEEFVNGSQIKSCIYTFTRHTITGATARILRQFLELYQEAAQP